MYIVIALEGERESIVEHHTWEPLADYTLAKWRKKEQRDVCTVMYNEVLYYKGRDGSRRSAKCEEWLKAGRSPLPLLFRAHLKPRDVMVVAEKRPRRRRHTLHAYKSKERKRKKERERIFHTSGRAISVTSLQAVCYTHSQSFISRFFDSFFAAPLHLGLAEVAKIIFCKRPFG